MSAGICGIWPNADALSSELQAASYAALVATTAERAALADYGKARERSELALAKLREIWAKVESDANRRDEP